MIQLQVGTLRTSALLNRPVGLRLATDRRCTRLGGGEDRVDAIGHIGSSARDDGMFNARIRSAAAWLVGSRIGLRSLSRLVLRLRGFRRWRRVGLGCLRAAVLIG
jgi:hypothetical protein